MTEAASSSGAATGPDSFYVALKAFLDAMETARDLEQFIDANAREIFGVEARFARIASRLVPSGDAKQHQRAAHIVHSIVHERTEALAELGEGEATAEQIEAVRKEYTDRIRAAIQDLTGRREDNYHYSRVWERTAEMPPSGPILGGSLLMGAVSDFEVLVSAIVRLQITARPEILRGNDQKFTFQELEAFSSLEEFRIHVAEKMADGLLRGGFEEWMDWFARRHKVVIEGVTDCPVALVEVFQRRHLLVHNGGVVNGYYLAKVADLKDPPPLGERLRVGGNYLKHTADLLSIAGIKLALGVARKVFQDEASREDIDSLLSNVVYDLLREGRYRVVREVTEWHLSFVARDGTRLVAMVNGWLARKHLDGLASISDEVEAWDTGTLAGRYKLVRLALLDRNPEAYALAKRLRAAEEITEVDWHTWPVLEGIRSYGASLGESSNEGYLLGEHSDLDGPESGGRGEAPPDEAS